jgi:hypothetical protein
LESQTLRKSIVFATLIFLAFIALGLFVVRCDFEKGASGSTLWHQLRRRLFDDDVPQNKSPATKQYDMTGI